LIFPSSIPFNLGAVTQCADRIPLFDPPESQADLICFSFKEASSSSKARVKAMMPLASNLSVIFPRVDARPWPGDLNLLEPRLVESHTTVIIPFDDRVIFVNLLNCAEFSSRLSEVAQTLDAISGIQFLVSGRGFGERWLPGTVRVRGRSQV